MNRQYEKVITTRIGVHRMIPDVVSGHGKSWNPGAAKKVGIGQRIFYIPVNIYYSLVFLPR